MTILVIDADSIVYAAAFAAQDWAVFDDDGRLCNTYSLKGDAKEAAIHAGDTVEPFPRSKDEARANTDGLLENIIDNFSYVSDVQVWLTVPDLTQNFRYKISEDYKGNRKDYQKPFHYDTVRQHLVDMWDAKISREGWEADDEVAAIGWEAWKQEDEGIVICSIDKDLDNVPGYHFRWPTHNKEGSQYHISEGEAMHNYWCQVLTGDNADNIPGLYRIGGKRADSLLKSCKDELNYYRTAKNHWIVNLEKQGIEEEEAVERMHTTCKLLYLMRGDNDEGWRPPE